jgi:hypothetical protein
MHIEVSTTQLQCFKDLKTLHPGGIRTRYLQEDETSNLGKLHRV